MSPDSPASPGSFEVRGTTYCGSGKCGPVGNYKVSSPIENPFAIGSAPGMILILVEDDEYSAVTVTAIGTACDVAGDCFTPHGLGGGPTAGFIALGVRHPTGDEVIYPELPGAGETLEDIAARVADIPPPSLRAPTMRSSGRRR